MKKHLTVCVFIGFFAPIFACAAGPATATATAAANAVGSGTASEVQAWHALRGGAVVLFRHALAPGGGDPPGMRVGDCKTQRNLSDEGRDQARRMGERLRQERVPVQAVFSSQWCRAKETAALMALKNANSQAIATAEVPAFNSLFAAPERQPAQTAQALKVLAKHKGPGALVVATHQTAITALTGVVPASGEGVVLHIETDNAGPRVVVVGRINP